MIQNPQAYNLITNLRGAVLSEEELNMKPDPIALVKEWIRTR
jgi:hypothetical protein